MRNWRRGVGAIALVMLAGCQPGADKAATASPTPMAVPTAEESVRDLDDMVLRWAPGMGAAQRDFAEATVRSTWLEVALAAGDWLGAANELAAVRRKLESLQASDATPEGVKQLTAALMPVVTHAGDQLDRKDPGALLSASQLASAFGRLTKDASVATWLSESASEPNDASPAPEMSIPPGTEESDTPPTGAPSSTAPL